MIAFPASDKPSPRRYSLPRRLVVDLRRTFDLADDCDEPAALRCYCHVLRRLTGRLHHARSIQATVAVGSNEASPPTADQGPESQDQGPETRAHGPESNDPGPKCVIESSPGGRRVSRCSDSGRRRCTARPRTVRHAPAYVVAYDVSDDRERRHVARVLESFGIRSQKSVFTCRLTRGWLAAMNERLRDLGLKTGTVLIAPVDHRRVTTMLGAAPASPSLPSRTAAIIV